VAGLVRHPDFSRNGKQLAVNQFRDDNALVGRQT